MAGALEAAGGGRIMVEEARSLEPRTLELVIFAVRGREAYEAFSSVLSSPLPDGS